MANRILRVIFKKIHVDGSIDTIFFKSRAKDVMANDDGSKTLADIVNKVDNVKEGATKTEASSTNGQLLIDGKETTVYKHPNSGVTAGTYNKVTVNSEGHVTGATNVTDWTGTVSGDGSNETSTFTQATTRENLKTGEKHSTMFGKISKWFADLKPLAFVEKVGTSNLDTTLSTFYNKRVTTDNVTTSTSITQAGWVADARAIASLKNSIDSINSKITNYVYFGTSAANQNGFRFRNITSMYNDGSFTTAMKNGDFSNIHVGDYIVKDITIDGTKYSGHIDVIVDLDPYYGKYNPALNNGSGGYINQHHVGIIPYNRLGTAVRMNPSNITTGGFHGSEMYTTTLPKYLTAYRNAYGSSHFLQFGNLISNATDTNIVSPGCGSWKGGSTDWNWYATYITLMSEVQVYGSAVWSGGYDIGEACTHLRGFALYPALQNYQNTDFWLRGVASATGFSCSGAYGIAGTYGASESRWVYCRPLLLLI